MKSQTERLEAAISSLIDLLCKTKLLQRILIDAAILPPSVVQDQIEEANSLLPGWWEAIAKAKQSTDHLHSLMERATDPPSERWTLQVGVLLSELRAPLIFTDPNGGKGKIRQPMELGIAGAIEKLGIELRRLQEIRDNPDREPELMQEQYALLSGKSAPTVSRMVKAQGVRILTLANATADKEATDRIEQASASSEANRKLKPNAAKPSWGCKKCSLLWGDGNAPGTCPQCGGKITIFKRG